jgi:cytochrome b
MGARSVLVWDLPTRAFHWLLVLGVVTSYLTGGEEGWLFVVHTASGYLIAVLLLFRVIWGVIGSPRSRFRDFVYGRRTVADHVRGLLWLTRENLVSAMISGSKQLDETSAVAEKPAASTWRMIFAAGVAAIVGAVLLARTDFAALATAPDEQSEHRYENHG